MMFQFDTLDQDTKLFLDPVKTLGDIGVVLTKADIEKAEETAEEVPAEDGTEVEAGGDPMEEGEENA